MKEISYSKLSELVADSRRHFNLSQQQLAEATGINRTMISHIESGEYVPSLQQLVALADALQKVSGVSSVEVNLDGKYAIVTCETSVHDDNLKNAVEDAGYEVKGMEDA